MKGLELEITNCTYCGGTHKIPLDASGHYAGLLPCDHSKRIELQVQPDRWREMVAAERGKVAH